MYIDYSTWPEKEFSLNSLFLDLNNPRLNYGNVVLTQPGIINFLIDNESVYELAKEITEKGYFVGECISKIKNISWIVSYDNNPNIQKLYKSFDLKEYTFNHSAYQSRVGQEVLFFSNQLEQPKIEDYNPINFKLIRKNDSKEISYNLKN